MQTGIPGRSHDYYDLSLKRAVCHLLETNINSLPIYIYSWWDPISDANIFFKQNDRQTEPWYTLYRCKRGGKHPIKVITSTNSVNFHI